MLNRHGSNVLEVKKVSTFKKAGITKLLAFLLQSFDTI